MAKSITETEKLGSDGVLGGNAQKQLRALTKRICGLEDQKAGTVSDLKAVYNEAKEAGFDTKILRKAVKRIRADAATRKAEEDMIVTYVNAIQPDLPFEAAA